ncbi:helix-turn-helix domain-containing protein [Phenylobacterium sp.]|uniref:helix-turn-helix domain-containing protein n=1 Tax=Phenylobacterium sp. TaxID=1871053 RepID=UPI003D26ECFF
MAKNLRRLRHDRGWSQEELADRASVDRTYVSSLEREQYSASIDMLAKLANALEVEPIEFFRGEDSGG